jgi:hypothetical protein
LAIQFSNPVWQSSLAIQFGNSQFSGFVQQFSSLAVSFDNSVRQFCSAIQFSKAIQFGNSIHSAVQFGNSVVSAFF